jgi:hypothetical protein
MREAELTRNPAGGQPLSRAFANCLGVYLFEQSFCSSVGSASMLSQLFKHVFGDDAETRFSSDYLLALMDKIIKACSGVRWSTSEPSDKPGARH